MYPLMIIALLGLSWTTQACAQEASQSPGRLGMEEAVQVALRDNPVLKAARQRVSAAGGRVTAARAIPNLEVQAVPVGSVNDNPVIASQVLDVIGKLKYRTKIAEAERTATERDYKAVELEVVSAVRRAYVDLQEALRVQTLMEEAARLARSLQDAAQKQFDLGDVARSHVVRTRVEVSRIEQELTEARREAALRSAELNKLLGRDAVTPVTPSEDLQFTPLDPPPDVKETALQFRPEIQTAKADLQARAWGVRSARAQRNPDIFVQTRAGRNDESAEPGLTGLGIVMPLWDWGSIRGQVKEAQAKVKEQEAIVTEVKNAVALEVESALKRLQTSREVVERYQQSVVPDAEELMKMMQISYAEGASSYLEVIDAQRTLTEARINLTNATAEHERSIVELRRAVGGSLTPPVPNQQGGQK